MQTKGNVRATSMQGIAALVAVFFAVSFFGWILEVFFFLCKGQGLCDRGFLSLPLCPVYGLSALLTHVLLGFPHRMRMGAFSLPVRSFFSCARNLFFYFAGGALICTLCELTVGLALDRGFGVVMWDYGDMPLQYGGYICLPFSLIWGALMLVFMRHAFLPLLLWMRRLQKGVLYALLLPTIFLFTADICVNSIYSFYTQTHLSLW